MFIEERHDKILELIKDKKRVEVPHLSKMFNISEDSIRRDLRIMEQRGLVNRTYGGAVLPNKVAETSLFSDRNTINVDNKEKIAGLASTFIEDNDTIILDGSTTLLRIVPFLDKLKDVTVITNSIVIAYEINKTLSNIKLVMLGGIVQQNIANTVSIATLKEIEQLNVDKVFVAPCFISAQWGLSSTTLEEAHIKRAMLQAGREVFLVSDINKIGQKAMVNIAPLKAEYTIIIDSDLEVIVKNEFQDYLKAGLKIIYPDI
ncbi:MAG: DeoR/GlpR transcriptional regulator [Clostridiaceae bacterium]|nr:DeoR/GlpR transcriptional regulator [Clostridiaceae bacterium]